MLEAATTIYIDWTFPARVGDEWVARALCFDSVDYVSRPDLPAFRPPLARAVEVVVMCESGISRILQRVATRIQHAAWLGYIIGAIDACAIAGTLSSVRRARLVFGGAAIGAIIAAAVGLIRACLGDIATHLPRLLRVPVPRARVAGGPRATGALIAGGLALAVFGCALRGSERITVTSLRLTVLMLGAAASIALALVLSQRMQWLLGLGPRSISGQFGYGISPAVRFAVSSVAPALAISIPLLVIYGEQLGVLRRVILLGVFLVIEHWTFLLLPRWRQGQIWRGLRWYALVLGVLTGPLLIRGGSIEVQYAVNGHALPDALQLLHTLTDVDRDDFSGVFGGRDCASFDSRRFPGAQEIPSNGIDENCDGEDGFLTRFQTEVQPKFSGRAIVADTPFHVVWYVVDSLRADHLPIYGYPHDTSPTLTELSREAWVFERAYSQSSTTALSIPSMFSGRNPLGLQYKRNGFPVASSDEFYLSRAFSARGYLTGFITNDWVRARLPGLHHGFEQVVASPPEANWHSGDYLLGNLNSLLDQAQTGGRPLLLSHMLTMSIIPILPHKEGPSPSFLRPATKPAMTGGSLYLTRTLPHTSKG